MRRAATAILLALGGPGLAQEGDALAQGRAAIESVILDQLGDFNRRDVPGAWEHASPLIQRLFGTPDRFGAMVEEGYPMVWTNGDAQFLELRLQDGSPWQKVLIRDAEGRPWVLDYEMVVVGEDWRIDGVIVLPAPEVTS